MEPKLERKLLSIVQVFFLIHFSSLEVTLLGTVPVVLSSVFKFSWSAALLYLSEVDYKCNWLLAYLKIILSETN